MPSTDTAHHTTDEREVQSLDRVVIRFAGDSGDGMQLTGDPVSYTHLTLPTIYSV